MAGIVGAELPDGPYHGVDLRHLSPDRIVLALWGQLASARGADWQIFDNRGKRMPRSLRADPGTGASGARNRREAHSRLNAEELQCFLRVAVLIPRLHLPGLCGQR